MNLLDWFEREGKLSSNHLASIAFIVCEKILHLGSLRYYILLSTWSTAMTSKEGCETQEQNVRSILIHVDIPTH